MLLNAMLLTPLFRVAFSLGFMPEQHIEHLSTLTVTEASLSQHFTSNVKVYERLADYNKVLLI
jgi:hypothetical protein